MTSFVNNEYYIKKGFSIINEVSEQDIMSIYHFLAFESYWGKGMPEESLRTAVENSMCFVIHKQGNLCGFARVITDKATFAYICDVFVLPAYRRQGLSKWLIQTVKQNPALQGLRRWSLATADAHGLYRQFGFTLISKPEHWMEIRKPYTNIP